MIGISFCILLHTDIDECIEGSLCEQRCTNTAGSYICSCYTGYILANNRISCTSKLLIVFISLILTQCISTLQTLMNAALKLTTVPRSVVTHRALTHAAVVTATCWIQMDVTATVIHRYIMHEMFMTH